MCKIKFRFGYLLLFVFLTSAGFTSDETNFFIGSLTCEYKSPEGAGTITWHIGDRAAALEYALTYPEGKNYRYRVTLKPDEGAGYIIQEAPNNAPNPTAGWAASPTPKETRYVSLPYKPRPVNEEERSFTKQKLKTTPTKETKSIAGHTCTEYNLEYPGGKANVWVANDVRFDYNRYENLLKDQHGFYSVALAGLPGFPFELNAVNEEGKTVHYHRVANVKNEPPAATLFAIPETK